MYGTSDRISDKISKFPDILWVVSILCLISIATLYSAANGDFGVWASKQVFYIFLGAMLIVFIGVLDIKHVYRYSYPFYLLSLLLLVLSNLSGHEAMGAQRWLRFGPLSLQPSELVKVGLILALSRYYHDLHSRTIKLLRAQTVPLLVIGLPIMIVLRQPSLGTAVILLIMGAMMMWMAGVMVWQFIAAGATALISLPFIWHFYMHGYQKQRVLTFLNPGHDPLGASYNIIQSKIAIGSGGITGRGWMQGSQSQLSFLPEKQTDFIFTVIAEEHGLIGSLFVLGLYAFIIYRSIFLSSESKQQFSKLLISGVTFMISLHLFINVAMVLGMIPVVGSPLPFLSYGGSNLLAMSIGIGLLTNSAVHRDN